ncbi:MAG TPA: hypothetical protein VFU74_23770 [Actinocrinis sp.]|nr:hypothetical protein [Actinocrinis sp.]
MRRRSPLSILAASTALPVAACLLAGLAGCGTPASQPNAALPAGGSGATPSVTASPSSTLAVHIPADYHVDIELNPTGDPAQDTFLARTRDMLMAYEQAVSSNAPNDGLYQSLTTSFARGNLYSMISVFSQAGERPTGSVRFYRFTVKLTGKVADVFFCQDTSKVVPVSFKTGQRKGAAATGSSAFSWWDTAFKKNSGGAWAIVYASSLVGRESCMS